MNLKNLVIILLFLCTNSLFAQNITGKITTQNNIPINNAEIRILNSESRTFSDKEGNFILSTIKEFFSIIIILENYASKIVVVDVKKMQTLKIVLESNENVLDEIIVTANKQEEGLKNIQGAVTSLSAKTIQNSRIVDLNGLTAIVPNYLYQDLGVGFSGIQSIRGIQVFSQNPTVSTYVDDVNNLDIIANGLVFSDIERIEVLRGPQSTLFGRNAMGGVVNIFTKKPTNKLSGFAEIENGSFGLQKYSSGIKTPIIKNKLYFGVNGLYQKKDGYLINSIEGTASTDTSLNGRKVGGEENTYGNLFLKWLVSAKLSLTANIKTQKDWSDNSGYLVSQTSDISGFENPRRINLTRIGRHQRNFNNYSLVAKYEATTFNITSITAFQQTSLAVKDLDFPGYYHTFYKSKIGEKLPPQEVITQEVRINSTDKTNKIQYITGMYAFKQTDYNSSLAYENTPTDFTISRNKSDNKGYAIFGEVSYKVIHKLKAIVGARYDFEEKKSVFNSFGDATFIDGVFTTVNPDIEKAAKYNSFSPKAALSYQFDESNNLYGSYTKGFRAGGINASILPSGVSHDYNPEYSNNFEVGYRTSFWKKKASLSATAFLINWNDLQLTNLVAPSVYALENVGDAFSRGIELEASILPLKGLQLDISYAINDAEYKNFNLKRVNFGTGEETCTAVGANKLSNAPKTTLFVAGQYSIQTSKDFGLIFRAELRNIGGYYTDVQNALYQPTYMLFNTRFGITYKEFGLFLWTKNLNNAKYMSYGSGDTSFGGRNVRIAEPTSIGVTLTSKF
ncbi:TonB-dependent receptor [Flavobacterium aquidurense]|uniref:TonB-dependent receptor n=1 Tax=Flavobacterium TaxID=237 RepID=UPI0037576E63